MTVAGANIIKYLPGQIADSRNRNVLSFVAEEAIEFGRPLMRGTNKETQCKNFVAGAGVRFLGISARSPIEITGAYPVKNMVSVFDYGAIWVPLITSLTIVAGQFAYLDLLTNSITNIRPALVANEIVIGRFLSSGTSNGLTGSALFNLELIPGFQI